MSMSELIQTRQYLTVPRMHPRMHGTGEIEYCHSKCCGKIYCES